MVSCGQTAKEFSLLCYIAERTRLAKLAAERNDSEGWGKSMLQWPKKVLGKRRGMPPLAFMRGEGRQICLLQFSAQSDSRLKKYPFFRVVYSHFAPSSLPVLHLERREKERKSLRFAPPSFSQLCFYTTGRRRREGMWHSSKLGAPRRKVFLMQFVRNSQLFPPSPPPCSLTFLLSCPFPGRG